MHSLYTNHIEEQVESASAVQLVSLLYGGLSQALHQALDHCSRGDHHGRAQAISKAQAILLELSSSLRSEAEPDLSARLRELYGYMFDRLQQANLAIEPAVIGEVLKLTGVLAEAWETISGAGPHLEAPLAQPAGEARVYCLG